jgi:hypothetical protein
MKAAEATSVFSKIDLPTLEKRKMPAFKQAFFLPAFYMLIVSPA